jgi:hypothetical protein
VHTPQHIGAEVYLLYTDHRESVIKILIHGARCDALVAKTQWWAVAGLLERWAEIFLRSKVQARQVSL